MRLIIWVARFTSAHDPLNNVISTLNTDTLKMFARKFWLMIRSFVWELVVSPPDITFCGDPIWFRALYSVLPCVCFKPFGKLWLSWNLTEHLNHQRLLHIHSGLVTTLKRSLAMFMNILIIYLKLVVDLLKSIFLNLYFLAKVCCQAFHQIDYQYLPYDVAQPNQNL